MNISHHIWLYFWNRGHPKLEKRTLLCPKSHCRSDFTFA